MTRARWGAWLGSSCGPGQKWLVPLRWGGVALLIAIGFLLFGLQPLLVRTTWS